MCVSSGLPFTSYCPDNHRFVWWCNRFYKLCYNHRHLQNGSKRSCNGFCSNGICNKPGYGYSDRTFPCQPAGMAFAIFYDRRFECFGGHCHRDLFPSYRCSLKRCGRIEAHFQHLIKTISHPFYARAFAATTLLATGGFMLMPFGSAFGVHNLGISLDDLPMLYMITGICSMITGPLVGKLSDTLGKYTIFFLGSILSMLMVIIYCNLGLTPLWMVILLNVIMFIGISSRMISSSALMTAVPEPMDRGAFMSINSSVQQISGGVASVIAGMIVVQTESGVLLHYDTLGYVVVGAIS